VKTGQRGGACGPYGHPDDTDEVLVFYIKESPANVQTYEGPCKPNS
jgi:hypothetical protein